MGLAVQIISSYCFELRFVSEISAGMLLWCGVIFPYFLERFCGISGERGYHAPVAKSNECAVSGLSHAWARD